MTDYCTCDWCNTLFPSCIVGTNCSTTTTTTTTTTLHRNIHYLRRLDGLDLGLESGPIKIEGRGLELAVCASIGINKEGLLSALRPLIHSLTASKLRSLEGSDGVEVECTGAKDSGDNTLDRTTAPVAVLLRCLLLPLSNEATTFQSLSE